MIHLRGYFSQIVQSDNLSGQFSWAVHGYFLPLDTFLTVLRLRSSSSICYLLINTYCFPKLQGSMCNKEVKKKPKQAKKPQNQTKKETPKTHWADLDMKMAEGIIFIVAWSLVLFLGFLKCEVSPFCCLKMKWQRLLVWGSSISPKDLIMSLKWSLTLGFAG